MVSGWGRGLWAVAGGVALCFAVMMLAQMSPAQYPLYTEVFMPPTGCPMPCFLGIRPGETVAEDAVAILEAHPWVGPVELNTGLGYIRWGWAVGSPRYLNPHRDNEILLERGTMQVAAITLRLDASTGDLWRFLSTQHAPDGTRLDRYIRVGTPACVTNPYTFWHMPVRRVFYTNRPADFVTLYRPYQNFRTTFQCG